LHAHNTAGPERDGCAPRVAGNVQPGAATVARVNARGRPARRRRFRRWTRTVWLVTPGCRPRTSEGFLNVRRPLGPRMTVSGPRQLRRPQWTPDPRRWPPRMYVETVAGHHAHVAAGKYAVVDDSLPTRGHGHLDCGHRRYDWVTDATPHLFG